MGFESSPTACVTGAGADGDSVWEQEKLDARKILQNAAESPASSARFVGGRARPRLSGVVPKFASGIGERHFSHLSHNNE